MAIKIDNTFSVPLAVPEAWRVLLDIPRVVTCMPGAELLEVVDENTYRAQVKARLGPVSLAFKGTARLEEADETHRMMRIKATGNEISGRGGAAADITIHLISADGATTVKLQTDLSLTGTRGTVRAGRRDD